MSFQLMEEEISKTIIGAAIEVHRILGPGLLESVYEACLGHELGLRGLRAERQVPLPLEYKDLRLEAFFRLDLLVEGRVVVEVKAVQELIPIYRAQLLTYLRLSKVRVGLLLNFNVPVLKDGIVRKVL